MPARESALLGDLCYAMLMMVVIEVIVVDVVEVGKELRLLEPEIWLESIYTVTGKCVRDRPSVQMALLH